MVLMPAIAGICYWEAAQVRQNRRYVSPELDRHPGIGGS